jgi:enoyl-CoA hydratase/carnithine racemase
VIMDYQKNVAWEKIGAIGVLSLNNPPENFIEEPEFVKIEVLEEISRDTNLKGLIIRGVGRHFSAGADMDVLKKLAQNSTLLAEKIKDGKRLIQIIENFTVPVVASISGVCFGAGLEIALACHFRICSENALFAFPETNHSIMPGMGGTVMLTKLIGSGRSSEIILTGETVNAQKALDYKLVDYIKPNKELHPFAIDFLNKITYDRDIEVISSVMKSIHNSLTLSFEKALEEETKLFCALALKSMQEK